MLRSRARTDARRFAGLSFIGNRAFEIGTNDAPNAPGPRISGNVAIERLLHRLSISPHRDQFILKGAMLFVAWLDDPFRPTQDLDLLGFGDPAVTAIRAVFEAICRINGCCCLSPTSYTALTASPAIARSGQSFKTERSRIDDRIVAGNDIGHQAPRSRSNAEAVSRIAR